MNAIRQLKSLGKMFSLTGIASVLPEDLRLPLGDCGRYIIVRYELPKHR